MYKNNIYKHAAYRLNVPPGETKDYRNLPFSHKSPPIIFPRLSTKDTPSNLYNIPTLLLTFSYKIIFRKSPGDSFQVSDYYQVKYYIWQYELTKQLTILQCLLNITQSCLHKQDDCDEQNELGKLNVGSQFGAHLRGPGGRAVAVASLRCEALRLTRCYLSGRVQLLWSLFASKTRVNMKMSADI